MTSLTKSVYVDKSDDIGNKYSHIYHRTIQIKPVDVKSTTYIDPSKDPKFKIYDIARTLKYKNLFAL